MNCDELCFSNLLDDSTKKERSASKDKVAKKGDAQDESESEISLSDLEVCNLIEFKFINLNIYSFSSKFIRNKQSLGFKFHSRLNKY